MYVCLVYTSSPIDESFRRRRRSTQKVVGGGGVSSLLVFPKVRESKNSSLYTDGWGCWLLGTHRIKRSKRPMCCRGWWREGHVRCFFLSSFSIAFTTSARRLDCFLIYLYTPGCGWELFSCIVGKRIEERKGVIYIGALVRQWGILFRRKSSWREETLRTSQPTGSSSLSTNCHYFQVRR